MSEEVPDESRHEAVNRRYVVRVVAAVSLVALTLVTLALPTPYATMKPGPVFDTLGEFDGEPMFTFGDGVKTYPTSGTLDFTTVQVSRNGSRLPLAEVIRAYFTDDTRVVPYSVLYPEGQTAEQSKQVSSAQLDGSKDSSKVAALRELGYDVPGKPMITAVYEDGAGVGIVEANDVVSSVDGKPVSTPQEVVDAVGTHKPGEEVSFTVQRGGSEKELTVKTKADPADPSIPRIGVGVGWKYTFPIEIDNNVGESIGGPSAGTMFALAIYDKLTPGELTGGLKVAGTGEMTPDGEVGPIGGVQQKIAGAYQYGAKIFLVPDDNCAEAVAGDTHGLKLVKIDKLSDAVDSLEALAEDRSAKVPTCS